MGSLAGKPLTNREREVLKMAACGLSNARIADALHLATATFKRHLANVYEKLEESSRNGALGAALAGRWLTWTDLLPDGNDLAAGDGAVLRGAVIPLRGARLWPHTPNGWSLPSPNGGFGRGGACAWMRV